MSVHFTEPEMVKLVEIYKEYDCLWNMKHEQYRDKGARQTAYNQIAEILNIPNLGAKDIPNKIKNLRSSYYQEIKKVRKSVRLGGKIYKPKVLWFSTVDSFLRPFRHEREFMSKMNKYGDLGYHEFSNKTDLIYANFSTFESRWQLNKRSGLLMKLYNSFNYAEDIGYEGRLMELLLHSEDFKLVLVLPNESDVLANSLFATLTNQGLAAAIKSIQPLFTANPALSTPMSINVKSRIEIKEKISALSNGLAIQYGTIAVSEEGARVKVLTCLYLPADTVINNVEHDAIESATARPSAPFYFAVVYQDTPIFYGDFKTRLGALNI